MARARASRTVVATEAERVEAPRSLIWLQGLTCGTIITLATASALLGAVLLAPAALAYRLDGQPGRPVARAVAVCTRAGALQPLLLLWQGGHGVGLAMMLLGDPWTLVPAWGAGAGGWILAELAPIGVRAALELAAVARAARLRAQRTQLERDWGILPADLDE